MSGNYRVELSSSNRAVCQATDCKTAKTKIEKGVLRMGTWVTYEDTGSWKWRHWGCITGKVLQNIRSGIADPNNPGQYLWDWLDGYDGEDKNGLQGSPDLQAKVRRVITQGFIDPEDWRGDPEMNVLGQTGMRTPENKKKAKEEHNIKVLEDEIDMLEAQSASNPTSTELKQQIQDKKEKLEQLTNPTPEKPKGKKRKAGDDKDDDDDAEDVKPAPKKRGRSKKEVDLEDEDAKPAPKPKGRAKKAAAKKEEANSDEDEEKPAPPAKKSRAKAVKKQEAESEDEEKPVPAKKPRAKKGAVKKEEDVEMDGVDEEIKPAPAKKSRAKKAAVKDEEGDNEAEPAPNKPVKKTSAKKAAAKEEVPENSDPVPVKAAPKKRGKAVKKEAANPGLTDGSSEAADLPSDLPELVDAPVANAEPAVANDSLLEVESPEVKSKKPVKAPAKATKSKAPAAAGGRGSRSRTASGI